MNMHEAYKNSAVFLFDEADTEPSGIRNSLLHKICDSALCESRRIVKCREEIRTARNDREKYYWDSSSEHAERAMIRRAEMLEMLLNGN